MTSISPDERALRARETLERRRAALLADVREDIRETCSGADTVQAEDAADDLDAGALMVQTGIRFSLMHLRSEMLVRIDEAIARIDAGTYGRCEDCGEEISDARLRAMPFALRCTPCEEQKEAADRRGRATGPVHRLTEERRAYQEATR